MNVVIASVDYTPDGGGIGAYANGLWRGLVHAGIDASVLSRSTPARTASPREHMASIGAGGSTAKTLGALRGWFTALRDQVRSQKSDWAVVTTWDPIALAATIPLLRAALPCRIAVVFHGADIAAAQGRKARLLRHVMRSADVLLANSAYTRDLLARRYGVASGTVLPGIGRDDLDLPLAAQQRADVLLSSTNVISVGRLVKRKGQAIVMAAVARLVAKHPDLSYTIVGDGPERSNLVALAVSLGIADRVHMTGHVSVDEKRRRLLAATVFALPVQPDDRDPEGFGIAYLEAGAARLPVLATRTGGVTECVRENHSGLFCEPTADSVTSVLDRLLQSRNLREELGGGGRRIAEASGWNHRALDLLHLLEAAR